MVGSTTSHGSGHIIGALIRAFDSVGGHNADHLQAVVLLDGVVPIHAGAVVDVGDMDGIDAGSKDAAGSVGRSSSGLSTDSVVEAVVPSVGIISSTTSDGNSHITIAFTIALHIVENGEGSDLQ